MPRKKKSEPEKVVGGQAEQQLQELLAEARSVLAVAYDIASQHGLDFKFFGVEFNAENDAPIELDANEQELRDQWDSSHCY